jgi:hypothetical protein
MDDAPRLLFCLNAWRIHHLIIGAHAMAFYGYSRPTRDLDILLDPESDPAPALAAFGITDLLSFPRDAIVRYGDPPDRIDLTNIIEGVTFSESWPGRVPALFDGAPTHVIPFAALVVNKLQSRRTKDHLDGVRLLQLARQG